MGNENKDKVKNELKMIKYFFNPHVYISDIIKHKRYEISDYFGRRIKEPKQEGVGVLDTKQKIPFVKRRDLFVGFIWLNKYSASPQRKWIVEIYGKDYFGDMIEIAKSSSLLYGDKVKIDVRFYSEVPVPVENIHEIRTDYFLKALYEEED